MVAISEISKNGSKAALQNRVAQLPRSQSRRRSIFFRLVVTIAHVSRVTFLGSQ